MTSFNPGSSDGGGEAEAVWMAIQAFVGAATWSETYAILQQQSTLLLSDLADRILTIVADDFRARSDPEAQAFAELLEVHHTLLRRCRVIGIEPAWREFQQWLARQQNDQPPSQETREDAIGLAVQGFVNAQTWNESYDLLQRDQALLLTDEADQILTRAIDEARSRSDPQAHQFANLLEVHRTLVRRCRELGIEAAWREFRTALENARSREQPPGEVPAAPEQTSGDGLRQLVQTWLGIRSTSDQRQFLEQHLELLDPRVDAIMQEIARHYDGQPETQKFVRDSLIFIQFARVRGVAEAWLIFDRLRTDPTYEPPPVPSAGAAPVMPASTPQLAARLQEWINVPTYRGERQFLEHHPELLDSTIDQVLGAMIQSAREHIDDLVRQGAGNRQQVLAQIRDLVNRQAMLRDARTRGGTIAAIREAYVNWNGGFMLDVPDWLAQIEQQIADLRRAGPVASARQRIQLWQDTIARARGDGGIAPETIAEMQNRLAGAFKEDRSLDHSAAVEQAIELHQMALRVYTRERYPHQWAMTQGNLGNSYIDRLAGTRRDNLEQAIAAYQAALQVYTRATYPSEWAMLQTNLGNAFQERQAGNRRDNLEQSLQCYQQSLEVRTRDDAPEDWAMTQNNMGNTYNLRPAGNRRENVEQAIRCFQNALEIYTWQTAPERRATTLSNLASTWMDRIAGDRQDNIERSIACWREVIEMTPLERDPLRWGAAQVGLGSALSERLTSDRRASQQEAQGCLESALSVFTRERSPQQWASIQGMLGNLFRERVIGDPAENIETAITHYQLALQVFTPELTPEQWAATQQHLGRCYAQRQQGSPRDNIEEAIQCYQRALRVFTSDTMPYVHASLQLNLGSLYLGREAGDRSGNVEMAISSYQSALRVFTRDQTPTEWAQVQANLGSAYLAHARGADRAETQQAIQCFQNALQVFAQDAFPVEFRETQILLGETYFTAIADLAERSGDAAGVRDALAQAHRAFAAAREVQTELNWLALDDTRNVLAALEWDAIPEMYLQDAWCLAQAGSLQEAAIALEAAGMPADRGISLAGVCAAHASAFQAQRDALRVALSGSDHSSIAAARSAFLAVRDQIRAHCQLQFLPGEPRYDDIAGAAAPDQALVYLAATSRGGFALIVPPALMVPDRQPKAVTLPAMRSTTIAGWLRRTDEYGTVSGGLAPALDFAAADLLRQWATASPAEATARLTKPLESLRDLLDGLRATLRAATSSLTAAWRAEVEALERAGDQQRAQSLRARLGMTLAQALETADFAGELGWFFLQAELEAAQSIIYEGINDALRRELDRAGLASEDQAIALVPCGALAVLPLHAAWARTAGGAPVPLSETCVLAYQPNAAALLTARVAGQGLAAAALAVGDPQPTSAAALPGAAQESATIVQQVPSPRSQSRTGQSANKASILAEIDALRVYSGGWAHLAVSGHSGTPENTYLLLANDERLTQSDLAGHLAGLRGLALSGMAPSAGARSGAGMGMDLTAVALRSGAGCVLVTRWAASDHATALLMARFMSQWRAHGEKSSAWALREATRWLRTASREQIAAFAAETGLSGDPSLRESLRGIVSPDGRRFLPLARPAVLHVASSVPYANCIYWGVAALYGS
jgi:CHAT domain-containing protein/tetratricopeptide (TPR) repeat protein